MERKEFFTTLAGSAALFCLGGLVSCSKSSQNFGGPISPFALDLSSQLAVVGDSVINGNVIVIRVASGNSVSSFVALSALCTHQGCQVNYVSNQNSLVCPCHGAKFSTNGTVMQGPAAVALTKYLVAVNGNILTVS